MTNPYAPEPGSDPSRPTYPSGQQAVPAPQPPTPPVPPTGGYQFSQPTPTPPRSTAARTRPWLLPTLTGVGGLVVGAGLAAAIIGGSVASEARAEEQAAAESSAARTAILGDAVDACEVRDAEGFVLGDGGTTLTLDNKGEDDYVGADYVDIACVFGELGMPSSVSSHVGQTTSMDGRQSAEWDDLELQWSYHPDRGMDGVITVLESE